MFDDTQRVNIKVISSPESPFLSRCPVDIVEEWNLNDEFVNGQFYTDSVTMAGYTLTGKTQLRFRCAAGNWDDVYIDTVTVSAQ